MSERWSRLPLREVAFFASGRYLSPDRRRPAAAHPVMGANGNIGFCDDYNEEHPVITVGRVGAYGEVHVTRGPTWVSDNALVVKPRGRTDFNFLAVLMRAIDYESIKSGNVQPLITQTALSAIEVDLPPLEEQRRIADLVLAAAAVADAAREAGEAARRTLTALCAHDLAQLTADPAVKLTTLGEVTTFAGGFAFPRQAQGGNEGGIPFYKVSDMNRRGNEMFMSSAENYIDDAGRKALRVRVHPAGTVVFPKVGAALLTEKRRILTVPATFDNNVMGVIPTQEVLPDFVYGFLTTVRFGDIAQQGALPSINQPHVSTLPVSVPSIAKQTELTGRWAACREVASRSFAQAQAAQRVTDSLSAELLTGAHRMGPDYDRFLVST